MIDFLGTLAAGGFLQNTPGQFTPGGGILDFLKSAEFQKGMAGLGQIGSEQQPMMMPQMMAPPQPRQAPQIFMPYPYAPRGMGFGAMPWGS